MALKPPTWGPQMASLWYSNFKTVSHWLKQMWSTMWQAELSPTDSNRTRCLLRINNSSASVWITWPRQGFPWGLISAVETDTKKAFSNSSSVSWHQDVHLIQQWPHIFPKLPFAADALVEAFLVVLDIPCQTQFQVGFRHPHHIPAHSDNATIIPPRDFIHWHSWNQLWWEAVQHLLHDRDGELICAGFTPSPHWASPGMSALGYQRLKLVLTQLLQMKPDSKKSYWKMEAVENWSRALPPQGPSKAKLASFVHYASQCVLQHLSDAGTGNIIWQGWHSLTVHKGSQTEGHVHSGSS